ncbi:hypothetical protein [Marinobacter sp.]|uniref:hypothetical protein n=1 Tax=Marinobacter sp. TaxID=50741 RepID=UPI003A91B4C0
MFKLPLALTSAILLSGCASTMQYTSDYQNNNSSYEHGEVYASLTRTTDPGFFKTTIKNEIEIFIDDELVTKAPLYQDYSGELYFFYQGMPVEVNCVQPHIFTTPECSVQINGKRSGKLAFQMR